MAPPSQLHFQAKSTDFVHRPDEISATEISLGRRRSPRLNPLRSDFIEIYLTGQADTSKYLSCWLQASLFKLPTGTRRPDKSPETTKKHWDFYLLRAQRLNQTFFCSPRRALRKTINRLAVPDKL
jgi:hypothetical protein